MNITNHNQSSKTEADLLMLVEPLASYIAAVERPRIALAAAVTMLLDNLLQIDVAANRQIAAFNEDHFG